MWKPVPSARQITIFGLNTRGQVPPLSQPSLMAGWERAEASRPRHEGTGDMESAGAAWLKTAGAKTVPILLGERPGQKRAIKGKFPPPWTGEGDIRGTIDVPSEVAQCPSPGNFGRPEDPSR